MRTTEIGDLLLGQRLSELRKKSHKSQELVAEFMRIHPDKLRRFERGKQLPTVDELTRWGNAIGLAPYEWRSVEALHHQIHHQGYPSDFTMLMQGHKNDLIKPYQRMRGWGAALSLQDCPSFEQGWRLSEVDLRLSEPRPFEMPEQYRDLYQQYFSDNYEERRLYEDGEKFMLKCNPVSFLDAPSLHLDVKPCRFSQALCYWDKIIRDSPQEHEYLIKNLIEGEDLAANFPQMLCLHLIVVTSDQKVLITERTSKTFTDRKHWSCSIEEQLARQDLKGDTGSPILNLYRRALKEELVLEDSKAYATENLRLLSVFLESGLPNIALCGYAELTIDSQQLNERLRTPPNELEFTAWKFLDLSREKLLRELVYPSCPHHSTTGYRLLLTFCHRFGFPTKSDIASLLETS